MSHLKNLVSDSPSDTVDKKPPANAGDTGWIPAPGRSQGPRSSQAGVPYLLKPSPLKPVLYKTSRCNKE